MGVGGIGGWELKNPSTGGIKLSKKKWKTPRKSLKTRRKKKKKGIWPSLDR